MLIEVQADIFDKFHDGSFTKFLRCNEDVDFIIDIQYLAETVNSKFTSFSGKLKNCSKLEFIVWGKEFEAIDDLKTLGTLDLEIISAKVIDNKIAIECNTYDGNCGGDLILIADDIMIFDESGNEIIYDELNNISRRYWNGLH
ncbi:hypothetical protein QA584_26390 [Anaerocolumna sp. AGMB13025]|uniref:hypothetical protein n=1 Tax=Anaerocolumna sp. AGMB13025 TaxID=3039116 RepID=UPI00241F9CBE|nr:hypothetical protein [Anaerocolumna sp. AGMB13025]WFR57101.1 hypothetical protein QA584_26390 [Anaerocolumna sp. AGMB13025]